MAIESPQPVKDANYHFQEASLTPPVFFGKGAERLGIAGVRADTPEGKRVYMNLFEGYATGKDGERIDLLHYRHPKRRGAFEYVVTDPKDVPIAAEVAGDTRIDSVRFKARAAVANYIEQNAEVKVTKQSEMEKYKPKVGKLVRRKSGNLVLVGWDHAASREGDPSRHWHLVAFNLSHDAKEGKNKAIELYHIDKPASSKIYRDAMRKGLNELGYKTRAKGSEYEIVGVPAEVKAVFSRRTNGIEEKVAKYERKTGKELTPQAKSKFSYYDRPEKSPDKPLEERQKDWRARLTPPQFKTIRGLVSKAREAVRERDLAKAFTRWQADIARHASKLRTNVIIHDTEAPERSRNNGRGR